MSVRRPLPRSVRVAAPVLGLAAILGFIASCAGDGTPERLLDIDYSSWDRTVEETIQRQIPGHGDSYRRIYINEAGTNVQRVQVDGRVRLNYPVGTIVLKENFPVVPEEATGPPSIAAMVKDPDHPDARGGWVWIAKNPETGNENTGLGDYCITCHTNANEGHPYGDGNPVGEFRDYTFYPYSP